jgi:tRNA pseudouridine55 synthase
MVKPASQTGASVDGFLNFYKPSGMTSMEALRQVKRITGQRKKVGHGGTMDPLARGVLPVCFGQATRLMDYLVDGTKRYQMEIKLGAATTTYDAEGEVVQTGEIGSLTREAIEQALQSFIGVIQQTPPMYSAIKLQGKRLYNLARAGIEVPRQPRTVQVYDIQIKDYSPPRLELEVKSGRGVYMRCLAHDLGQLLGCGGYVTDLVRLYCGGFAIEEAVTLEQLEQVAQQDPAGWREYLRPVDWVLRDLQSVSIGPQAEQHLRNGQSISLGRGVPQAAYLERFRAYSHDGRFLALVCLDRSANAWRPIKVFHLDAAPTHTPLSAPH